MQNRLGLWFFAACLATQAAAQSDLAFTWGFLNGETELTQCQSIDIQIVDAKDSTQPYYMYTYPVNSSSAPSFTTFGRGETNNMTLAPYEPGTEIVMGMVDAFGSSGGWTSSYKIKDGGTDSCVEDQVNSNTPITANLNTTEVGTCGTVGVTIKNGKAPYTITVFPINSVATTFNITTSSSDNYLSFVNDLGANLALGFGVRDNEMNWAKTAGPVSTFGTTQKCDTDSSTSNNVPEDDSGGDSSGPNNSPSDSDSSGDSSGSEGGGGGGGGGGGTGAAVGGAIGGVAAVALLGVAAAWWFGWCCFGGRRRRDDHTEATAYDAPAYSDHSPQPTPGPNSALLHPYGGQPSSAGGSAGGPAGGAVGNHSRSSLDTTLRPMSQVSSGYNQMGGFRLVNPDADAQETMYPPTAAYARPHTRHSSWDSQHNSGPQQQQQQLYQQGDFSGSSAQHLPHPTSSHSDGQFMEGFEPHMSSQPQQGAASSSAGGFGGGGVEMPPMSVSEKAAALMAESSGATAGSSRRVHQHTDAGPAQQEDEELPPAYAGLRQGL